MFSPAVSISGLVQMQHTDCADLLFLSLHSTYYIVLQWQPTIAYECIK